MKLRIIFLVNSKRSKKKKHAQFDSTFFHRENSFVPKSRLTHTLYGHNLLFNIHTTKILENYILVDPEAFPNHHQFN